MKKLKILYSNTRDLILELETWLDERVTSDVSPNKV